MQRIFQRKGEMLTKWVDKIQRISLISKYLFSFRFFVCLFLLLDTIVNSIIAPRDEYTPLFDFVNTKKLRIKNKGLKSGVSNLDQMIDSDDDEHDAYLQKVKQEGREKEEDDEDDDSDESEGKSLVETCRGA